MIKTFKVKHNRDLSVELRKSTTSLNVCFKTQVYIFIPS